MQEMQKYFFVCILNVFCQSMSKTQNLCQNYLFLVIVAHSFDNWQLFQMCYFGDFERQKYIGVFAKSVKIIPSHYVVGNSWQ